MSEKTAKAERREVVIDFRATYYSDGRLVFSGIPTSFDHAHQFFSMVQHAVYKSMMNDELKETPRLVKPAAGLFIPGK